MRASPIMYFHEMNMNSHPPKTGLNRALHQVKDSFMRKQEAIRRPVSRRFSSIFFKISQFFQTAGFFKRRGKKKGGKGDREALFK